MSIELLLVATATVAASGWPGLLMGRRSRAGQWVAAALNLAGSTVGAAGLIAHYWSGEAAMRVSWPWMLAASHLAFGIDGLSALFLMPMLLISALGSVYGLEYWDQRRHPRNGRKLRLWWGLLTGAMMAVALARDAVVFLMAWEIMALATFFLMVTEDEKPEVSRAGWIYLIATHVGTLSLFALFGLLRAANGSFDLWAPGVGSVPAGLAAGIFITGMVGFGMKAGLMPLHVWLPGAHANAPSHVSAILSGVLLKAGVYGIVRVAAFLPHPPTWWGATLLAAGSVTGVIGIAFAVAQRDFKRLLAYSSIENVGIIAIGIGLALLGRTAGRPDWIMLGLGGALLHVLNHSLFKPLLFMGAGSILHAAHTREMDQLGGLAGKMPRTFGLMMVGAAAICGLPPLNGFVSEFLIYAGLFGSAAGAMRRAWMWAGLAAPALAAIGALAVAAFVKLLGTIFAGKARTSLAEHAHDPGPLMLGPMVLLGACCVAIGLTPMAVVGVVERAVRAWDGPGPAALPAIGTLVPLYWLSIGGMALLMSGALICWALRRGAKDRSIASAGTWDCGYARPTARIQYTGSSFGQMLAVLCGWVLVPRRCVEALRELFPGPGRFSSEVPDPLLDRALVPAFSLAERVLSWARPLQGGTVHVYLLYVLAALLAMLLFVTGR